MEKRGYSLSASDIIRVTETSVPEFEGYLFFLLEVNDDGSISARSLDGKFTSRTPLEVIDYIKTEGKWWKVVAISCTSENHDPDNEELAYDLLEVEPCVADYLEKRFSA